MTVADSLNPSNFVGFELVSGTSGQSSPFANNSGTFGPISPPAQSPPLVNLPGANLSSGNPSTPLPGSNLSTAATPAQQQATGTTSGVAPTPTPGPASGSIADYFARGVIVVLGFIFVAVGLHMLMPSTVPDIRGVAGGGS